MKQTLIAWVLAIAWTGMAAAAESQPPSPAAEEAERWLRMLDEERYEEAWQQTATLFRSAMSYEYFMRFAKHVRRPVVARSQRVMGQEALREDVPGLPTGTYFDVTFESTSAQSRGSEHLLLAPDGCQWKVTSYELQ